MEQTPLRTRVTGVALAAAVGLLVAGWTVAWSAHGAAFVPGVNYISDLGATDCRPRSGRWICSPRHLAFNASSVLAGLTVLAVHPPLRRRLGATGGAAFACLGGGLVWIGLVPGGVWPHLVGVVAALPAAGALFLVSGFRPETAAGRATAPCRATAGVTVLVCSASDLTTVIPGPVVIGSEYVSYLVLLAVTLHEGAAAWREASQAEPT